ncbi:MAG: preprotein translocase subunit SecE [Alphaproteobacteria bacterium]|nr:preprotein translocase subunit SecE [Alphaproteobacteria bacterium]
MANTQNQVPDKKKTSVREFFRETRREISKITWPVRKEISVTTMLIVAFAVVMGLFFLVVDSALGFVVSNILGMHA